MITLLSYVFYFIAATVSPLQRRWLAKTKNPDNEGQIHFAFQVSAIVALFSLLFPFFQPFHISGNIFHLIGLTLVSGIFGAGFAVCSYIAQKHVEAGITSVLGNIYTPITIILATFFLGERLTFIQIVGTALLLFGIVIVSKKHRIGRFTFDKYFWMMLFSGVPLSFMLVATRALVKITGFTAGSILSWWAVCICLGVITLVTRNKSTYSKKDVCITGGLRFLQDTSWTVLGVVVGNLSLVSSVTTFKVVLVFIAGALFLDEREDFTRKLIGALIAVAGLFLMK